MEGGSGKVLDNNAKFPGLEIIKSFAVKNIDIKQAPEPVECIIQMINMQLKVKISQNPSVAP